MSFADGKQTLVCDSCEEPLDENFDRDQFQAMIDYAKTERWTIQQEDGSWRHYCPDCTVSPQGNALRRARVLFGKKKL